jgi:histone acetyltransferase
MFGSGEQQADGRQAICDYRERMSEMKRECERILDELQGNSVFAAIFDRPVTEAIAPHYFKKIERPMDICTMRKRLRRFEDYSKRPEMFAADICLIIENCKAYNPPETIYFGRAVQLKRRFRVLYRREFPIVSLD